MRKIYLDNSATTFPKPLHVRESMLDFFDNIGSSSGRSGNSLSIESGRIVYEARESLSNLINQADPLRTIFTQSATHSLNFALKSLLKAGDIVVATPFEHNSVARVLSFLQKSVGIKIRTIPAIMDKVY